MKIYSSLKLSSYIFILLLLLLSITLLSSFPSSIISTKYNKISIMKSSSSCNIRKYQQTHQYNNYNLLFSTPSSSTSSSSSSSFDADFAEAISKPLPEWYKAQKLQQEKLEKEIEINRERIMKEFQAKYDIDAKSKMEEINKKWEIVETKRKKMKIERNNKNNIPWYKKILGNDNNIVNNNNEIDNEIDNDDDEELKKFWEDEQKSTGFYLPGFFEVFPELKLKWPIWARRKDGQALKCERDEDCQFPQACCPHPIIPGDKFCCTGWGQRIMSPSYQGREITSNDLKEDFKGFPEKNKNGNTF